MLLGIDALLGGRVAVAQAGEALGVLVGLAAGAGLPGLAVFWGELGTLVAAWRPAADRPSAYFMVLALLAAAGAALLTLASGSVATRVSTPSASTKIQPSAPRAQRQIAAAACGGAGASPKHSQRGRGGAAA